VRTGSTVRMLTGCGHLYVTVNVDDSGRPIEVFAYLGKAGSCMRCMLEGLTRVVTLSLKHGVPVGEVVNQLVELRCPRPLNFPRELRATSCVDAVARALRGGESNGTT